MCMKEKLILIGLVLTLFLVGGCLPKTSEITEEYCTKIGTDESLSLSEAKQMAVDSECGDRLKDTYMCNDDTGTWWIDLDIETEMCNPACVVNVATRQAEINWRCMGVLPQEFCEIGKEYEHNDVNPVTCKCPEGYEFETVSMGWGPCPREGMSDCPASVLKCVKESE